MLLNEDVSETARRLLRARGKSVGASLTELAREHAHRSSSELLNILNSAPRHEKAALGLLLARLALEDALNTNSQELFGKFLFRFAAHLKASVGHQGLSQGQRYCLAEASRSVFFALPSVTSSQKALAADIVRRFSEANPTDSDWTNALGMNQREFNVAIELFARQLTSPSKTRSLATPENRRRAIRRPSPPRKQHPAPTWLLHPLPGPSDSLVTSTANWLPEDAAAPVSANSLTDAWSAFAEKQYGEAKAHLLPLLAKVGKEWAPSSSADVLRAWNWLRLVSELANLQAEEATDTRRSWASSLCLAARCLPDDDDLIDTLIDRALADFAASDMASTRAWCVYTLRIVAEMGHERALESYSNADKASLRSAWSNHFNLASESARSTVAAVDSLTSVFQRVTQTLYIAARDGGEPSRVLTEIRHELTSILDEGENELLLEATESTTDAARLILNTAATHTDLRDVADAILGVQSAIALSGSLLLQEFVSPLLELSSRSLKAAVARLGDISRPELVLQLASTSVPFSATPGSTYAIRFIVSNNGNTNAESIRLQVTQAQLALDEVATLDNLGPGARAEVTVEAVAMRAAPTTVDIGCRLSWTDALRQQFQHDQELSAEDQKPVSWTSGDVNPFSLGTITDPERLVGRASDLEALDALIAGRASAYITGQKRVGKTSLAKVLMRSLRDERGWAGSLLPLGRALGADQGADDLVYALLDEILFATKATYGAAFDHINEIAPDLNGNFARAANRWLRGISRLLPVDARVVVAIDDFDELPAHLIKGPQADALFLFMRSLVDEPWLNLIVVGSEVLPSIIQEQAHKLNQVVPVSVSNFATRESTSELLTSPTKDRLEWQEEAVSRVHHLCGGNPYYETLLAQRLWQDLRVQSRSTVTAGDVEAAALSVARESSESHFVHLWADSSTGIDHTARKAVVASAVLRSVARCGGQAQNAAAQDEVVRIANNWIQTATTDELNATVGLLQSRQVLSTSSHNSNLYVAIPLVGIWLMQAGARALDQLYASSKHATATTRMITDGDLVQLAKSLRYKGEQVTEIRIKAWLEQFGDHYHQYLAFKLLRRMILDGYWTSSKLQEHVLPKLAKNISALPSYRSIVREANNQNLKNAFLLSHGVPGDSTQGTLSLIAKALKIKKANILDIPSVLDKIRGQRAEVVVFLLDDFCGSGGHLSQELGRLLDALGAATPELRERINVVVGAGVVADEADLPASPIADIHVESVSGITLGERFRAFSPESGIYDSAKERSDAETMVSSIGNALVKNAPLGFGARGILTLFEFNCPNNVPPVFWKSGNVSGTQWVPLFERQS